MHTCQDHVRTAHLSPTAYIILSMLQHHCFLLPMGHHCSSRCCDRIHATAVIKTQARTVTQTLGKKAGTQACRQVYRLLSSNACMGSSDPNPNNVQKLPASPFNKTHPPEHQITGNNRLCNGSAIEQCKAAFHTHQAPYSISYCMAWCYSHSSPVVSQMCYSLIQASWGTASFSVRGTPRNH
jgi:hypothetical protein